MNKIITGVALSASTLVVGLAVGFMAGNVTAPATAAPAGLGQAICYPGPTRLAIFGDSITSWDPPFNNDRGQSWVFHATSNSQPVVGGYARPGATLAEMAAGARPLDAEITVIMGGTNDLPIMAYGTPGTPVEERLASIDHIATTVGADRTVILAVPPFGWNYYESEVWNAQLAEHAAAQGYIFIDPWVGLRDSEGGWYPWLSADNVHPSPWTAGYVGDFLYDALQSVE